MCVAVNSDKKAGRASKKLAGGLDNVICLCIGASVMLTKNIWTNAGLVNGAVGTVVDFIKDASDDTKADVVVVDIPRYRGPPLCGDEPGRRTWVPVQKTKAIWFTGVTCTRSQFPLALAWGVTIHKRFANIVSVRFDT